MLAIPRMAPDRMPGLRGSDINQQVRGSHEGAARGWFDAGTCEGVVVTAPIQYAADLYSSSARVPNSLALYARQATRC